MIDQINLSQPLSKQFFQIVHHYINLSKQNIDLIDPNTAIYQTRKVFKAMRSLLRLTEYCLDKQSYALENQNFRDLGRMLASDRDKFACLESLDYLAKYYPDYYLDPKFKNYFNQSIIVSLNQQDNLNKNRANIKANLINTLARIEKFAINDNQDKLLEGFKKTYKLSQKEFAKTKQALTDYQLHEWRKMIKHHRAHIRLLLHNNSAYLKKRINRLSRLSDILGAIQDLSVLQQKLSEKENLNDSSFNDLIKKHKAKLVIKALAKAEQLHKISPKKLVKILIIK